MYFGIKEFVFIASSIIAKSYPNFLDDSNKNKFLDAGSTSLKVFKNNSEVPSYYELPADVLEHAEEFIKWAKESFAIQLKKNK